MNLNTPEITLSLSENERHLLIGYSISLSEPGVSPPSKEELTKKGKKWIIELIAKLRRTLCDSKHSSKLKKLVDNNDEMTLCLAISDIVITMIGSQIPPMVISAQIVKVGLKNICDDTY